MLLIHTTAIPLCHVYSRVSVDEIQEELKEWQKEVDKVKEMMSSLDGRAEDFLLQLQEFVSVSAVSVFCLLHSLLSLPLIPSLSFPPSHSLPLIPSLSFPPAHSLPLIFPPSHSLPLIPSLSFPLSFLLSSSLVSSIISSPHQSRPLCV